jgi:hypothetical protein
MAAFHFGEMTREEWDRWSMDEKFGCEGAFGGRFP